MKRETDPFRELELARAACARLFNLTEHQRVQCRKTLRPFLLALCIQLRGRTRDTCHKDPARLNWKSLSKIEQYPREG